jgi:tetratricopeptide (TPR) repeat protein
MNASPGPEKKPAAASRRRPRPLLACVFCGAPVAFFYDWWFSRNVASFWLGLPALTLAATISVLVLAGARTAAFESARIYRESAQAALTAKELPAAELYFRRLRDLQPHDAAATYGAAVVAELQGDRNRARRLMRTIAPLDWAGYGPAHYWLARDLLARRPLPRELLDQLQQHLQRAVERQPGNVTAHFLLCDLLTSSGQTAAAVEFLARTASVHPALRLRLAKIYATLDKKGLAQQHAALAREQFQQLAEKDPDNVAAQLQWSQSELLLGKFADAVAVLNKGWKRTHDQRYRTALAELHLAWAEMLAKAGKGGLGDRLELLQRGLSYAPRHPAILNRLAALAGETGEPGAAARRALKEALASGDAPAAAHLMLGTAAAVQGDPQEALLHLEQAYRLDSQTPEIINNLAWVLAASEPPQWERAEKLANAAVTAMPNHPEFRETRGQILARLGRWKEAAADLELALQRLPRREENSTLERLHRTLADAYEHMGDQELAAAHRRFLERKSP